MKPAPRVLAEFGARGELVPLAGGRGGAWRAGDVVLKPLDLLPSELEWLHAGSSDGVGEGLRVSLPLASRSGTLLVDGWTAFPLLAGAPMAGRRQDIAEVAHRFSDRFSGEGRPGFVDERDHAWARADRFAWDEEELREAAAVPQIGELLAARREVDECATIIHGDLAGNVLFHETEPPAVIDPTVYWRPARFAVAIVAVDAVCFEGAPLALLEDIERGSGFPQHLLRALIYRMATDVLLSGSEVDLDAYRKAARRVRELAIAERH